MIGNNNNCILFFLFFLWFQFKMSQPFLPTTLPPILPVTPITSQNLHLNIPFFPYYPPNPSLRYPPNYVHFGTIPNPHPIHRQMYSYFVTFIQDGSVTLQHIQIIPPEPRRVHFATPTTTTTSSAESS